ncbi:hypothetical protein [Halotalea alkalilenta]|uniref:HAAAP family serine/threonine permease n=1 Tax=Halotalea alkalilenta TaxID=376489 RepID=A0A172YC05_9GAMM|nr:hypothetical protein [Halotalea alkalilenta]ANF56748.1 HAAAP family serine/threonine permease [Halotalea alkalilenta]
MKETRSAVEQDRTFEHCAPAALDRRDVHWILGLYGTAVGAGTLFLPINAGIGGFWPLLMIGLLAFPITFFAHRGLTRFVLSGAEAGDVDITDTLKRHFGAALGRAVTLLYFFAIFPILLVYSVAITNTVQSFIEHQLGLSAPPRAWLAAMLIASLVLVARGGQQLILRAMSMLVYPFIAALIALALFLIPHWDGAFLASAGAPIDFGGMSLTLWLAVPVMVFSFNHSPMISAFAVGQHRRYGAAASQRSSRLLAIAHLMMVVTVMFFVLSCVMTLTPADLAAAKAQNVSILSYLANRLDTPLIALAAPLIAFIAIGKSFLGHYIGAREGLRGLLGGRHARGLRRTFEWGSALGIAAVCWGVATLDPSILGLIEGLGGPVIAALLFLMPMIAIATVPALARYRRAPSNPFVVAVGVVAISATLYGLFG